MRTGFNFLLILLFSVFFCESLNAQQVAKTIPSSNALNGIIGFLEFRPTDYSVGKHPLIIFLHGVGERGNGTTDINLVTANAIPRFCANGATMRFTAGGQTSSFVVLSPQLYTAYGSWPDFYFQEMLKYAKANLNIDTNRIYVTGLSLGGGGTWRAITTSVSDDNQIAAAAPVCGTQDEIDANFCSTIGGTHLPVWAFHCYDDGTVPVNATYHAQVLASQCSPSITPAPLFTIYQSGGHSGAWIYAYDTGHITTTLYGGSSYTANPNLYEWLLSNSRSTSTSPIVNAGSNQSITLPTNSVTLTGTGSGTKGAVISNYNWVKTSGPAGGSITNPGNASTTVTGLLQGVYIFTLTVTDNNGLSSSSSVTITVNAIGTVSPVVNAGVNQVKTLPGNTASLSGSVTAGPGANIVSYLWTQTSGPAAASIWSPTTVNTGVGSLVAGVYVFSLKATDNYGLSGTGSMTVTVNPAVTISQPTATASPATQQISLPSNTATLSGSGTSTNGAAIQSYLWAQTSGPSTGVIASPNSATTTVSGLVQGVYTFSLTVTDNNGISASTIITITVSATANGTLPPVVNAGVNQVKTLPYNTASLSGTATAGSGASIVSYLWSQTSGPAVASIWSPSNAATGVGSLVTGTYVFTLTAKDNSGLTGSSNITVTVNATQGANQPPVANAGSNQTKILPVNTATLSGTGTGMNGATIVSYSWSQASGPNTSTIVSPASASTSIGNLVTGVYTFTFTVKDNNGLSASANTTVTVLAAIAAAPVVNAGVNQVKTLPYNTASLNGTATVASGSTIVSFAWTQSSGPAAASIWNPNAGSTGVGSLVPGVYVFTLTALDNNGLSGSSSLTVTENATAAASISSASITDSVVQNNTAVSILNVYPNPVHYVCSIELNSKDAGIKIISLYNSNGLLIRKSNWSTFNGLNKYSLIGLSNLSGGLYIITVTGTDGKLVGRTKFVKL
jgi:predicted esterase